MLGFQNISVFILATVAYNSYQYRITPVADGWGKFFPQLYFVFGRNVFDKEYLDKNCTLVVEDAISKRRLIARNRQTPLQHSMQKYKCTTSMGSKFYGLFSGNCTGEYYGIGPTCRCQEAMRYFITHSMEKKDPLYNSEWFVFMDDDLFVRPFVFLSLLSRFGDTNDAIALVPGIKTEFRKKSLPVECYKKFAMAMPGIMNRQAIITLTPAVEANGMTAAQAHWKGTHDVLFGYLMWLYDIKVLSLHRAYSGGNIFFPLKQNSQLFRYLQGAVLFHKVKGEKYASHADMQNLFPFPLNVSDLHKIDRIFIESYLEPNSVGLTKLEGLSKNIFYENVAAALRKDALVASKAYNFIQSNYAAEAIDGHIRHVNDSLALISFKKKYNLSEKFVLFKKKHCFLSNNSQVTENRSYFTYI